MGKNIATKDKRCEAWTRDQWFETTHRCPNRKAVQVNGKELCGRHAALEALAVLIASGKARALPPAPTRYGNVYTEPPPGLKVDKRRIP